MPKDAGSGLGRALIKAKRADRVDSRHKVQQARFGTEKKLESVIEANSLDSFLERAELAQQEYEEEKEMVIVDKMFTTRQESHNAKETISTVRSLRIPHRPVWTPGTSAEVQEREEKQSFHSWRKELASIEENNRGRDVITPYEKNLEVWRQLWRVVERSDVVVQILDARNPLIFRCNDLEEYVQSLDHRKTSILVLNKSDGLTESLRLSWARWFISQGVRSVFFSARQEQEKLDSYAESGPILETEDYGSSLDPLIRSHILTREELLCYFESLALEHRADSAADVEVKASIVPEAVVQSSGEEEGEEEEEEEEEEDARPAKIAPKVAQTVPAHRSVVIGMVGYPNVGKSSLINVLIGLRKGEHGPRVAVGSTPGKTKHFQTIVLSPSITLCDCPGLVFPSFAATKGDMILNGILPISQLREPLPPLQLLTQLIPRRQFEEVYHIHLPVLLDDPSPDTVTVEQLMETFCQVKGFMAQTHSGVDMQRGARTLFKDFTSGRLLYCSPPPTDAATRVPLATATAPSVHTPE